MVTYVKEGGNINDQVVQTHPFGPGLVGEAFDWIKCLQWRVCETVGDSKGVNHSDGCA